LYAFSPLTVIAYVLDKQYNYCRSTIKLFEL
jgi:hypothetical protein